MLDLYYWMTPNGHKITLFLEEAGLPYNLIPVNIGTGAQFAEDFLRISPNNKIPALVDSEPMGGGEPVALFESGAILQYLAEKTGQFLPSDPVRKYQALQWLYWQVAHLGPMLGQLHHFMNYSQEKLPYAIERYQKEAERLYGILDDRLAEQDFIAGDYSIVDMASYPWILPENQGIDIGEYPHIARWQQAIKERPAVIKAYARAKEIDAENLTTDDSRKVLFGQGRRRKSTS